MSTTVVHLLRHGKVHNPANILYGRLPGYRLAASGRAMAAGVAEYLAGSDITYLAASSLQRAQETAAPLAARFGLPIVTDDRVIEAANDFEGLSFGLNSATLGRPRHLAQTPRSRAHRPGVSPTWTSRTGCSAAIYAAVQAADGHAGRAGVPPAADRHGPPVTCRASGSGTTRAVGSARSPR